MKAGRWRRQLRRSLGLRLVLLFLLLALATTAVFLFGMQRALSGGWNSVLRPLVADYVDRLAAEIGAPVALTGTEFELLVLLAREPQKVFDRDQILNRLRGHEAELHTRAVDILVSRLRRKLEPLDCIKTLRNAGYAFAGARA